MKLYQNTLTSFYMLVWSPFLLVTSVVVLPIKGSTPAFIMAFFAFLILLLLKHRIRVVIIFVTISICYLFVYLLSQFGVAFGVPDYQGLILVDPGNFAPHFRVSHLTQTLYLVPGFFTFLYFRFFYEKHWDKYLSLAVLCLGAYGLYECIYFILFHQTGDFLTNRSFGVDSSQPGSASQLISLGGFTILRFKSLVGEPSMYAFTVLPFWIYFITLEKRCIATFLFITLLLSTSMTAILGILIYIIIRLSKVNIRKIKLKAIFNFTCIILFLIIIYFLTSSVVDDLFEFIFYKLTLNSNSGVERFYNVTNNFNYWLELNPICKMFGVGFGTIRSTEMFTTLLVNVGLVGLLLYVIAFCYPLMKLKSCRRNAGIKYALAAILITSLVSVSEFSYLSIWIFLGLAYKQLNVEYFSKAGHLSHILIR